MPTVKDAIWNKKYSNGMDDVDDFMQGLAMIATDNKCRISIETRERVIGEKLPKGERVYYLETRDMNGRELEFTLHGYTDLVSYEPRKIVFTVSSEKENLWKQWSYADDGDWDYIYTIFSAFMNTDERWE